MKKKSKLWIYFSMIIFVIMFITAIIMAFLAVLMFRLGHLNQGGHPLIPIIFLLFLSVAIGTVISLFVAKKILKPITGFSKAASEVAKGDFTIHLDETEHIEEIRELTHNFNVMVQELSSIETLRNDFVVNVSHEFKTPIASIEGYATLLQNKVPFESDIYEYAQMIIESAHQLSTLSDNILYLSKLENQEVIVEKESFRLDEQVRQAILMLEPKWSEKNLDLQIDLEKIVCYNNKNLLFQVWMNLIGNAIKFTPKDGVIGIRLLQSNFNLIIKISDTGCGMYGSVLRHIFDKFYQGDTTRKAEGNGLGLALVKRIVDLCSGHITVVSKINKGSEFTITLPK